MMPAKLAFTVAETDGDSVSIKKLREKPDVRLTRAAVQALTWNDVGKKNALN